MNLPVTNTKPSWLHFRAGLRHDPTIPGLLVSRIIRFFLLLRWASFWSRCGLKFQAKLSLGMGRYLMAPLWANKQPCKSRRKWKCCTFEATARVDDFLWRFPFSSMLESFIVHRYTFSLATPCHQVKVKQDDDVSGLGNNFFCKQALHVHTSFLDGCLPIETETWLDVVIAENYVNWWTMYASLLTKNFSIYFCRKGVVPVSFLHLIRLISSDLFLKYPKSSFYSTAEVPRAARSEAYS